MANPINASIVMLLTESLRKLAQQLADGERVEDPYGNPEEDAERLLAELGLAADAVGAEVFERQNPPDEKEPA